MKSIIRYSILIIIVAVLVSCSDDSERPDPTAGLVKVAEGYAVGAGANVQVWAKEDLFTGYNEVYIALYDSVDGSRLKESHIHLHPEMTMTGGMTHACPWEDPEEEAIDDLFPAAIIFSMPSGDMGYWTLDIRVHNHHNDKTGSASLDVMVLNPSSPRLKTFVTANNDKFYMAYNFKDEIKVGVNPLEVIAFRKDGAYYVPAEDLSIVITPEMPSMDHGSPNNINPVHTRGGHYDGKVNFTMTGLWRMKLELIQNTESIQELSFDITL